MGTVDIFESLGVLDVNDTMPPYDPGSGAEDFQALRTCWQQGPENTPGCTWVNPPGAYCDQPQGAIGGDGDQGENGEPMGLPCGDEFDPSMPCIGPPETTACVFEDEWYWCEDGRWTNEK